MSANDFLTVATLTKPHGVRGEVKIICDPEFFPALKYAATEAVIVKLALPDTETHTGDEYEVTLGAVRGSSIAPIIAIDGIEDRNDVAKFRGAQLRLPRELLPELGADEYRLSDLVGLNAHCSEDESLLIGKVTKAELFPANIVLTVETDAGTVILAPFINDAVPSIDLDRRILLLNQDFLGLNSD